MGELVSADNFVMYYGKRHGSFPDSFYRAQTISHRAYVPEAGELAHFLKTGIVFGEYPYRRIKYFIPDEERGNAFNSMVEATGMSEIHSAALPFDPKRSVTSRLRLRGEYADERGRATIIAGITNPEQVDYFTFTWHGVVAPPADFRPAPNVVLWRERSTRRA